MRLHDNRRSGAFPCGLAAILILGSSVAIAADPLAPRPAELMPKAASERTLGLADGGAGVVAVGDRGHILLSEDGQSWRQVQVPVRTMLTNVEFVGTKTGWAIGHDWVILKTTDGGESWKLQHRDAEDSRPFFDTHFDDSKNGFVVGSFGTFKRTTDGGNSWEDVDNPISEFGMHLYGLTRLNDGTLMLVGERSIMARSADNGESWEMIVSPYAGSWFGALPYGDKGVILHGLRGNVFHTNDVSALQAQDPYDWDEFDVETVEDEAELAEMGWRKLPTAGTDTMLAGSLFGDSEVWLTGVNGPIYRVSGAVPSIQQVRGPDGKISAGILRKGNRLIVAGQQGLEAIPLN